MAIVDELECWDALKDNLGREVENKVCFSELNKWKNQYV